MAVVLNVVKLLDRAIAPYTDNHTNSVTDPLVTLVIYHSEYELRSVTIKAEWPMSLETLSSAAVAHIGRRRSGRSSTRSKRSNYVSG